MINAEHVQELIATFTFEVSGVRPGRDDDIAFSLLDSLDQAELVTKLERAFGVVLSDALIATSHSLSEIVESVLSAADEQAAS